MGALEIQVGGGHYKSLAIQPVRFWQSNLMGASEGSAIKYVTRWRDKGGVEDLRKARHFLDLILDDRLYLRNFKQLRQCVFPTREMEAIHFDEYVRENALPLHEAGVIMHLWFWNVSGRESELVAAGQWLDELIREAIKEAP